MIRQSRGFALSLALFVVVFAVGCGSSGTPAATSSPTAPLVALSATSLTFGSQIAGSTSAAQVVTLTNTGTAALAISGVSLSGSNFASFAESTTCGTSVAVGGSCTISVSFAPTAAGSASATVSIADNAGGSPQAIALTGTGLAPAVALSASSLSFSTNAGTTSAVQMVTLTNTGSAPLSIAGVSMAGANVSSFVESTTCSTSVAAGGSCAISVSFQPVVAGAFAAAVSIADNAPGAPHTLALLGTGTAPTVTLSVSALTFTTPAESTSATQTVTLSNTGNGSLSIASVALTGTDASSFNESTTCGSALNAGASCSITLSLTAFLARSYTANIAIASSASATPQTVAVNGTGTGTLTIDTTNPTDWVITNGAIRLDWNSQGSTANIWSVHLTGSSDDMVDTTTKMSGGQPYGLYEDDSGDITGGTVSTGYNQVGNQYIDWWQTTTPAGSTTNAFTESRHFVITANDAGFHVYSTTNHATTDITGSLGSWGKTFRINQTQFTNTYTLNQGLNSLGVQTVPLPTPTVVQAAGNDAGRAVQNAVTDLSGLTLPTGFGRLFETKYDYATSAYLHLEHGLYGSKYGAWIILPNADWRGGGPTKQSLCFTYNILSQEFYTTHLDNGLSYTINQGTAFNRLWGPNYYHFNTFTSTNTTPGSLYAEAQTWLPWFNSLYDNETNLVTSGYVPTTGRGTVTPAIVNGGSSSQYTAWSVLGDNAKNFQYSIYGRGYWVNQNATGTSPLSGVAPGTYRLSSYVLGQWGELRQDNVVVSANQATPVNGTLAPENFGTSAPVWTIGTPDRSGHEFFHGHDASGNDLRNYWGAYNFWADYAKTSGTQTYYATAVGSTPATNDPTTINYVQWGTFDPLLYGGIYNAADDTTDGYNYIIPSYVASLATATGTNGVKTPVPPLTIHFTTTATQLAQGQYTVLSVGLACAESDLFATLNGQQYIWHTVNASDCMVRSGLTGYYQWIALQWPTSALKGAGVDNVLTLQTNNNWGVVWDALRMEITNKSASPTVTGWNDYEYLSGSTYVPANDAVPNN